jgi:hypothetical protein
MSVTFARRSSRPAAGGRSDAARQPARAKGLSSRVRKFHTGLGGAALTRRLATLRASMKPADREALVREVDALRKLLGDVARAMR